MIENIMKILKTIYNFLFKKHDIATIRILYLALIPCAIWKQFCTVWMIFLNFVLILVIQANTRGWSKEK